ncbi:MAG: hypothetical protein ACREEJ_06955, partial [Ensifer adhaerens]
MAMAAKTVIIAVQRQWHSVYASDQKAATKADAFSTVDVQKDVLNATKGRSKKTDAAKATSMLDKLTDEERKSILSKYA